MRNLSIYGGRLGMRCMVGCILLVALVSCGRDSASVLGPQQIGDLEVFVETRPGIPRVGMNEFLVVATYADRKPGYDYVVSIQLQGDTEWRQSIQDGHSGVYRRALNVRDPEHDVVRVMLEKQGRQSVLQFPLNPKP